MRKLRSCLLLTLLLLTVWNCAGAEPSLAVQDTVVYPGPWASAYHQILQERSADIQAYQDYVTDVTYSPLCRAVGLTELTRDGIP